MAKVVSAKQKHLLSIARKEQKAMQPIVRRALAKHGRAGEKVYVVLNGGGGVWAKVSTRGRVRESPPTKYAGDNKAAARKK